MIAGLDAALDYRARARTYLRNPQIAAHVDTEFGNIEIRRLREGQSHVTDIGRERSSASIREIILMTMQHTDPVIISPEIVEIARGFPGGPLDEEDIYAPINAKIAHLIEPVESWVLPDPGGGKQESPIHAIFFLPMTLHEEEEGPELPGMGAFYLDHRGLIAGYAKFTNSSIIYGPGHDDAGIAGVHETEVLAHGLLRLSTQFIERTQPSRPQRRRMQRAKLPVEDVLVVRLRRRRGPDAHEGGTVDWQHRWIVSGHWRHQPCGPGRQQTRLQWISPYVKGPDDKPLVVKQKVTVFNR